MSYLYFKLSFVKLEFTNHGTFGCTYYIYPDKLCRYRGKFKFGTEKFHWYLLPLNGISMTVLKNGFPLIVDLNLNLYMSYPPVVSFVKDGPWKSAGFAEVVFKPPIMDSLVSGPVSGRVVICCQLGGVLFFIFTDVRCTNAYTCSEWSFFNRSNFFGWPV